MGPTGAAGTSSGKVMIAAGWDSGGENFVLRSTNRGVNWSATGISGLGVSFRATAVAYNGVTYVLSTDQATYFSEDGLTWTEESNAFSAANFIKWNGKQYVASTATSGDVKVYTSANGIVWNELELDGLSGSTSGGVFSHPLLSDVASDGGKWVGIIDGYSPQGYPFIVTNTNGASWTDAGISGPSGFMDRGYGISYAEGVWVAVGSSEVDSRTTIMRSTDGRTWLPVGGGTDTTDFGLTGGGSYVASNGVQWVAVGGGHSGSATILTSSDNALTWTSDGVSGNFNSPSGTNTYFNSVKWNGYYWVAVGTAPDSITYSLDGLTWVRATATFPDTMVNEVASDYIQSILGGVGSGSSVGETGPRGTIIYYGYGGPTGTAGWIYPGPTGVGPTGPGIAPQRSGDFYLDFNDGRLYLTP
jgi:hypothetical protein